MLDALNAMLQKYLNAMKSLANVEILGNFRIYVFKCDLNLEIVEMDKILDILQMFKRNLENSEIFEHNF
ncbi:hypothetical protein QLX08_003279 [Tetragonisca angustula]|uniref:Uncharacterized protein n=1 Tax=Tetragonisca angustula TaxID=166442 RepID=A0AAW1AA56_9HYME